MVTPLVRHPWFYVTVGGNDANITDDYTQTEALVGAVSRVLQMQMSDTPSLSTAQSVTLTAVDLETGTQVEQFAGLINNIRGTQSPNQVTVLCTGPLAR